MPQRPAAVVLAVVPLVVLGVLLGPTAARDARPPAVPTSAALPPPPAFHHAAPAGACPVTEPNGRRPPNPERVAGGQGPGGYGNEAIWTNVWMWGEGEVAVPATHVAPSGAFGPMKWSWYQYGPGLLKIDGRRLDGPAPPLETTVPAGYGGQGFHPTGLIFPTGGCWEVTGRVGEASLTFVTRVVPPTNDGASGGSSRDGDGWNRSVVAGDGADT